MNILKSDQNNQVIDFLGYYFKLASPQYAVMLCAPWGAGKTWFIKEYIKKLPETAKPIYVTLNGVSSKSEIEDQFFEQMHPLLAHKATKLGTKVVKGLIKGTLQIDLNSDGKAEGSAAIGVPDVGIKDFLKKSDKGSILIFDDLERCDLPIHQVLGYINYFVEHDDARVILLANEDEVVEKEKREISKGNSNEENKYLRIREKLIGKTFAIFPDIDEAMNKFLQEVADEDAKEILMQERGLIAELHSASKSENLRHLRQAILEFERIVLAISPETRNVEMLRGILGTFLVCAFEIRSGNLRPEQMRDLDSWTALMIGSKKGVKQKLHEKYPQLGMFDSVLPGGLWATIMGTGLIDRTAMATAIGQSQYYAKEVERRDWLRLNDAFEMEDASLAALVEKVIAQLQSRSYTVLGELMHITGSLMSLASIGVVSSSSDQVAKWAISNLEELRIKGLLPLSDEEEQLFASSGWAGRSFHGQDDPEFTKFLEQVDLAKTRAKLASYPKKATELLQLLRDKDVEGFSVPLSWSRGELGKFARDPVLASIRPQDFVEAIGSMNAKQLAVIGRVVDSRYRENHVELKSEKAWLDKVAILMEPLAKNRGAMSDFYKKTLRNTIVFAIDNFPD